MTTASTCSASTASAASSARWAPASWSIPRSAAPASSTTSTADFAAIYDGTATQVWAQFKGVRRHAAVVRHRQRDPLQDRRPDRRPACDARSRARRPRPHLARRSAYHSESYGHFAAPSRSAGSYWPPPLELGSRTGFSCRAVTTCTADRSRRSPSMRAAGRRRLRRARLFDVGRGAIVASDRCDIPASAKRTQRAGPARQLASRHAHSQAGRPTERRLGDSESMSTRPDQDGRQHPASLLVDRSHDGVSDDRGRAADGRNRFARTDIARRQQLAAIALPE